ncbi:MAG: hypothetical protein IKR19_08070 [Acholeplasmatales bacterium]|nr:hypothetical protein [Acholeplasmatales bacterium]
MTDLEKSLLSGYIIAAHETTKRASTIVKAIGGEETTTIGDEIQSAIVYRIQKYFESFSDDKEEINRVMEQDIIPQITCGNYINTISSIESFEMRNMLYVSNRKLI